MDELIYAEDCIKTACVHLREYLDIASTFNGSEILIDYSTTEPEILARSIPTAPEPALITHDQYEAVEYSEPIDDDYLDADDERKLKVHPMAEKYRDE